jgi:hypothetical protein
MFELLMEIEELCLYPVHHYFFNQDLCYVPFRVLKMCLLCILQME